jgi:alpha-amylase/alpha-mannosidase (GH57 family)
MTRVAILWHMHQPFYQDLLTGEHMLPWVRLHATKDYWGMVDLLRAHPTVKVTFNLVPSLLVQLEAFAREEARDRHLELGLRHADQLSAEERTFCVAEFFHAHRGRMIDPHPRYRELLALRDQGDGADMSVRATRFSVDDIRDLQVWHKLVWIDADYLDRDTRVAMLLRRGRGFSEDDKRTLREVELEILRRVIPEYSAAAARGQVELSTSPFYHPILPLLCDSDIHLRAHPHSARPRAPFRHPEDAAEQLTRAVALHERMFGIPPRGVWPSEGSVSDAMVPLVKRAGLHWMATDEQILARTLGVGLARDASGHLHEPEILYRSYSVGGEGQSVACAFRDHRLSDLIGFTYGSWPTDLAADDFVGQIVDAGRRHASRTGGEDAIVFVILDGENAWESYEAQGRPFLHGVYERLGSHPEIQTVTMSEACANPTRKLPSIFPGSWINSDFYIWMGHADDHRAWSQVGEARDAIEAAATNTPPDALARAREELYIAEGSDWYWWYGDDHSSDHDREFDDLFRRHVRNIYDALGRPIPAELFATNITTEAVDVPDNSPEGLIQPTIDGEITSYFEWMGAGSIDLAGRVGAMHATVSAPSLQAAAFGCDTRSLYVRIDATRPALELLQAGLELYVKFIAPAGYRVVVRSSAGRLVTNIEHLRNGIWDGAVAAPVTGAASSSLELRIPFAALGANPRDLVMFVIGIGPGSAVAPVSAHEPATLRVPTL